MFHMLQRQICSFLYPTVNSWILANHLRALVDSHDLQARFHSGTLWTDLTAGNIGVGSGTYSGTTGILQWQDLTTSIFAGAWLFFVLYVLAVPYRHLFQGICVKMIASMRLLIWYQDRNISKSHHMDLGYIAHTWLGPMTSMKGDNDPYARHRSEGVDTLLWVDCKLSGNVSQSNCCGYSFYLMKFWL